MCKYSHDYILTSEQLVSLANNAKKAPCNWLKNGENEHVRFFLLVVDLTITSQVCNARTGKNVVGVMSVLMDRNASILAKGNAGSREVKTTPFDEYTYLRCFLFFFFFAEAMHPDSS
jgi:hypothetical protein